MRYIEFSFGFFPSSTQTEHEDTVNETWMSNGFHYSFPKNDASTTKFVHSKTPSKEKKNIKETYIF